MFDPQSEFTVLYNPHCRDIAVLCHSQRWVSSGWTGLLAPSAQGKSVIGRRAAPDVSGDCPCFGVIVPVCFSVLVSVPTVAFSGPRQRRKVRVCLTKLWRRLAPLFFIYRGVLGHQVKLSRHQPLFLGSWRVCSHNYHQIIVIQSLYFTIHPLVTFTRHGVQRAEPICRRLSCRAPRCAEVPVAYLPTRCRRHAPAPQMGCKGVEEEDLGAFDCGVNHHYCRNCRPRGSSQEQQQVSRLHTLELYHIRHLYVFPSLTISLLMWMQFLVRPSSITSTISRVTIPHRASCTMSPLRRPTTLNIISQPQPTPLPCSRSTPPSPQIPCPMPRLAVSPSASSPRSNTPPASSSSMSSTHL